MSTPAGRRAALFDVDETLLAVPSLWRFLAWTLQRTTSDPEGELARIRSSFRARAAVGTPREQLCRDWAGLFAGRDAASVEVDGSAWFIAEQLAGPVFVPETLAALAVHRACGDLVVLVSGSVPALLAPVARAVGADVVLSSVPSVRDGVLTGDLDVSMIGEAKAAAVRALAHAEGLDLRASSAYGDHASDLPLLRLVGDPVVVGADPGITGLSETSGWRRLRTSPSPTGRTASAPTRAA